MSRWIVFALGIVFGAIALHLLAPRVDALVDRNDPPESLEASTTPPPSDGDDTTSTPQSTTAISTSPPTGAASGAPGPVSTDPENSAAATSATPATTPEADPLAIPATTAPLVGPSSTTPAPAPTSESVAAATVTPNEPAMPPVAAPPPSQDAATTAPESVAESTVDPGTPAAAPEAPAAVASATPKSIVEVPPDIPASLLIPVAGANAESLRDTFTERRSGGARPHDAIDIMAPTGTPVHAVADGKIVKLFLSDAGGITIYQFDVTEKFAYYYAHLERYADGLKEGNLVKRGDVIGYVGYTGNANPAAPHLHFAVIVLGPEKRWWEGIAINPYPILVGATKDAVASK